MDAVRLENDKRRNQEEAHIKNVEIKNQERNKRGEKAAVAAIGFSKASLILAFRNQCMSLVNDFDYAEAFLSKSQLSKLTSDLYHDTCRFLLTNSAATFVAAVSLIDADTLHYHTVANRRDRPSDGESESTGISEIDVKELSISDDSAYVLKRGSGVSWSVVDEMTPKFISDTKYAENLVFFDGEKRKGTYLAVCLARENRAAGMLCADTLDSTTGVDLAETDIKLFNATSIVLSECLDRSTQFMMTSKREICNRRLANESRDPSMLPEPFCKSIVEAVDCIASGCWISVGMMDSAMHLRLVYRSNFDGAKESNKVVTVKDKGREIPTMFQCFQIKTVLSTKDENGDIDSLTIPVMDESQQVSAVIYIATKEQEKNPLSEQENVEFFENVARLATPVLLIASKESERRLSVLTYSGVGDSSNLFALVAELCTRHTTAKEIFIGFSHGENRLRIVKSTEGWYAEGSVISNADMSGCFHAMRTNAYYCSSSDYVSAPLSTDDTTCAFGVVCLKVSMLEGEQQAALEGTAKGLGKALVVSEFRRKMVICGHYALESLIKRTAIAGAYLSFFDIKGREICGHIVGNVNDGIKIGHEVKQRALHSTEIIPSGSEAPVGLIGIISNSEQPSNSAIDDNALQVLNDCAAAMGNIAQILKVEGINADKTLQSNIDAEEILHTHFKAARFDLVTEKTVNSVDVCFIDKIKKSSKPQAIEIAIIQAIMYILGHQQRDVSEWPKCRKLLTHHLFKEMKMIDVRSQLKVHKLKLAQECISNLEVSEIESSGSSCHSLWKWVRMILEVQELE
uniref:Uncharacterized protein n=2 Tax=Cryptomonas curvata TaxID=233186 RepID=A0A7S0MJH0_9CRYP|mmetsp:Transcript_39404/g.82499  ORF Transcript_39404/g.82499 Transcript_39404/m.82499 type:complete len:799 (+) Transcript_39404:404-2800(+)